MTVNIYKCSTGEWCYALFTDDGFDTSDTLGCADEAGEDIARAEASALFPDATIVRVGDVDTHKHGYWRAIAREKEIKVMASVYDLATGHTITEGLQGCRVCDQAIQVAADLAKIHNKTVILDDDDGEWLVGPRGRVRKFTAGLKRRYGFSNAG
jgi:hypothetical protein